MSILTTSIKTLALSQRQFSTGMDVNWVFQQFSHISKLGDSYPVLSGTGQQHSAIEKVL